MGYGSVNAWCPLEQVVTWASQRECRRRALLHLGKSPEVWDLASSRASLLGRDSPSQKPSAGESRSDTITPGFFYLFCVCVCELLEVIYVGINEIIWPN